MLNGPGPRLLRVQWAPLLALAVLTLITAALAVTLPAATVAGLDDAAARTVDRDAEIRLTGRITTNEKRIVILDKARLDTRTGGWRTLMPANLRTVVKAPERTVELDEMAPQKRVRHNSRLILTYAPEAEQRIRYVAGTAPATGDDGALRVGMPKETADKLGYTVGSRLDMAGLAPPGAEAEAPVSAIVSGVYEPVNARDPFWRAHWHTLRTEHRTDPAGSEWEFGRLLLDEDALDRLAQGQARKLFYTWRYPVVSGLMTADRAAAVPADVQAFSSALVSADVGNGWQVGTALTDTLRGYAAQKRTAGVLLGLAFSGLIAVLVGALLLAAGLFADRLRPVLTLMRARGASLGHLVRTTCGLVALAALPAAALGYLAGRAVDAGPPQTLSVFLVAGLAVVAVGLPALLIVREHSGVPRAEQRVDSAATRPSRRRLTLEALVVTLAVISVVLARGRGLSGQAALGGLDPFVACVPALLGVAVALLVMRLYPYPMRALTRLARRGRGTVAFVGLARASNQHLVSVLPMVVLLLVAAVAGFAASAQTALRDGQETAAWRNVGADARVFADRLENGAVDRLRAVPGVTGAVGMRVVTACELRDATGGTNGIPVTVIAVDLNAYRRVVGDHAGPIPAAPAKADGALVSKEAAALGAKGRATVKCRDDTEADVTVAGGYDSFPIVPTGTAAVIVPLKVFTGTQGQPGQVLLKGDRIDRAKLRAAALPVVPETLRDAEYLRIRGEIQDGMRNAPLVGSVGAVFRDGVLIAAGYGLLTILLVLAVGARGRSRAVAHLQVQGFGPAQRRMLAVLEIAPVLLCAALGGWALGVLLPVVLGPMVDLRPYTDGQATSAAALDPLATAGLVGALLVAAALAAAVDTLFDARHRLSTVLRTGE